MIFDSIDKMVLTISHKQNSMPHPAVYTETEPPVFNLQKQEDGGAVSLASSCVDRMAAIRD
jgi:hypothetical protein